MRKIVLIVTICLSTQVIHSQNSTNSQNSPEANKAIARAFYEDLWFSNNTENYKKYVADQYVVHDIGDRKGITEAAIEQKNIADFFWENGELGGKINYQVAEGNLVVTHWTSSFDNPKTLLGRFILGTTKPFNIINVFRIEDGKIVEFWNHRHDIETPQTLRFVFQGLLLGLVIALIPTFLFLRTRKQLRKALNS